MTSRQSIIQADDKNDEDKIAQGSLFMIVSSFCFLSEKYLILDSY